MCSECANVQMCKCADVQMCCEYANEQMFIDAKSQ